MDYVIGIDGGGTGARLFAAGPHMEELFRCTGGGVGLNSLPESTVRENLQALLADFVSHSGLPLSSCRMVCLGAAGAGRDSGRSRFKKILADLLVRAPTYITHDGAGALCGGLSGGDGVLAEAGTGSICYARRGKEFRRTGGWGHIMGDEGSGYDIGRQILQAIVREADGEGEGTVLTRMVLDYWGLRDTDGLVEAVYGGGKGKSDIAGLAYFSNIAYNMGDGAARGILSRAAGSLADLAAGAADSLWGPGESPSCAYAGGVLENSPELRALFRQALEEKRPDMSVGPCAHGAAWGCAALAWEQAEGGGRASV